MNKQERVDDIIKDAIEYNDYTDIDACSHNQIVSRILANESVCIATFLLLLSNLCMFIFHTLFIIPAIFIDIYYYTRCIYNGYKAERIAKLIRTTDVYKERHK